MAGYKKETKTERTPIPGGYVKRTTTIKTPIPEIEDECYEDTPGLDENYGAVLENLRKESLRELGFKP